MVDDQPRYRCRVCKNFHLATKANIEAAQNTYFTENEKYKAFVETMDFAKIRPTVMGYSDVEKTSPYSTIRKCLFWKNNAAKKALEKCSTTR